MHLIAEMHKNNTLKIKTLINKRSGKSQNYIKIEYIWKYNWECLHTQQSWNIKSKRRFVKLKYYKIVSKRDPII